MVPHRRYVFTVMNMSLMTNAEPCDAVYTSFIAPHNGLGVNSVGVLILDDDRVSILGTTVRDILGDEC
jgi:hypothetical protein